MNDENSPKSIVTAAVMALVCIVPLILVASCGRAARADQLIAFGAEWCGPCKSMVPTEDKLIHEGYRINRVDIDKNPKLAKAYRVSKVPTFVNVMELADGRCYETGRIVGACSEGQLRRLAV